MIYLDNAATTAVSQNAAKKALYMMTEGFGNPSSLHNMGENAALELENARRSVALALHAEPKEIYFTSGGTEANNAAIFGAASLLSRRGNGIVTTDSEHPSVLEPIKVLEKKGCKVYKLKTIGGEIDTDELNFAVTNQTILVSIMLINNETGAIYPVKSAANAIKRVKSPALLHCDAVQAFLKLDIMPSLLGIDLLSVSGHKVHAPKGVGALYVKSGVHIPPFIFGGKQEKAFRSGTENLPAIAAFGVACNEGFLPLKSHRQNVEKLSELFISEVKDLPNVVINIPKNASPYIISLTFRGYNAETLVHCLSQKDICISAGSACKKGAKSEVLNSFGLSDSDSRSTLRISFCGDNTEVDVTALADALKNIDEKLRN